MTVSSLIDTCNTFSENLASPEGFYGEVVSGYIGMAFETMNHWTVDQMSLQPGESVLEVGFGPGLALRHMLADELVGSVVGIDTSPLMVQKAGELNAAAIRLGRLTLMEADVCRLPDFGHKFDKIVAINTTMYWPEAQLGQILRNLRQCLTPGGMLFISFQRLYDAYLRGEKAREINGYRALLQQAGFLDVENTIQSIADPEAAIAEGGFVCIAVHGVNPALAF